MGLKKSAWASAKGGAMGSANKTKAFLMRKTLTKRSAVGIAPDAAKTSFESKYSIDIAPPGGRHMAATVCVIHRHDGQHTLTWPETTFNVSAAGGAPLVLKAGACNLFTYPKVTKDGETYLDAAPLSGLAANLLEELVLHLAGKEPNFMETADGSGAQPTLALMVANTDRAITLVKRIFSERPEFIPLCHVPSSPFYGENALHVLAVNCRESDLCEVLDLAATSLSRRELEVLFYGQARGGFFHIGPMNCYGGCVLSYCVAFSLHRAVTCMMLLSLSEQNMTGLIDPNDPTIGCEQTGFLPLHVAVVNSLTRMYDFLIELPNLPKLRHLRAQRSPASVPVGWGPGGELTPLQLATFIGDERMFQHIMRRRSTVLWAWGPVTQFQMSLEGIDSIGASDNDVMNLVARSDATPETRELLGDDMMAGFLFNKLFVDQKWKEFGRFWYGINIIVDIITIFAILLNAVAAKLMESYTGRMDTHSFKMELVHNVGPYFVFIAMVPSVLQDAYLVYCYYLSVRCSSKYKTLCRVMDWMSMHGIPMRWFAMMCAIGANIFMLITEPGYAMSNKDHQFLRIGGERSSNHDWLSRVFPFLAVSLLLLIQAFAQNMLAPFEKLGKYYIFIWRIFYDAVIPLCAANRARCMAASRKQPISPVSHHLCLLCICMPLVLCLELTRCTLACHDLARTVSSFL